MFFVKGIPERRYCISKTYNFSCGLTSDHLGFQSGSWLSTLIGKLILHVSSAVDSMEALEGSHPDREQDVLYHPNDARYILHMYTTRFLIFVYFI